MSELLIEVETENWNREVLDSETPVLIDFWADWCGPCRSQDPIVEQFARDFEGKLRVAKVDIDEYPDLADQFEVRSIPTLLLLIDGQEEERLVGLTNRQELDDRLKPYVEAA